MEKIIKPRTLTQVLFILLCLWIGIEFIYFVIYFETNGLYGTFSRPPGVDGFLPISSLMNFIYYLRSGEIHSYHPAGLFILMAICLLSLAIGKAFCSWLCFIGTLSEKLADFSEKHLKLKLSLPKFLDIPLRSLKYIILLFFLYHILTMNVEELKAFLDGDYNLIADIKMYYFFAHISTTAFIVICFLIILSLIIRNFWCRYLCPYGALLGLFGLLSPFKIKRHSSTCINCNKCTSACPSQIQVAKINYVVSDECSSCLRCVEACPVKNTLDLRFIKTKQTLSAGKVAIIICAIFIVVTGIGILTNNWGNHIDFEQYRKSYQMRNHLKHH